MATTTKTLPGFFEEIFREVINQSARTQPEEYPTVLRVLTSNRNLERFKEFSGLPLPVIKPELQPVQFRDPTEGGVREVTHTTFALGFKVSFEAMEDDKFDIAGQTASSLGDVMREGAEIFFAEVWNNADANDPAPILTFDGRSLLNDGHTGPSGNQITDNLFTGDISIALIQAFRYHFRNLRNDQGLRNQAHELRDLIIAPDATTEPILDQILNATQQPFTADTSTPHELGAIRGRLRKKVYSYLTDTDRIIALSQIALTKKGGPFAMWRRQPSTTSWEDESIQGACFAGSFRASRDCPDFFPVAGSIGV